LVETENGKSLKGQHYNNKLHLASLSTTCRGCKTHRTATKKIYYGSICFCNTM